MQKLWYKFHMDIYDCSWFGLLVLICAVMKVPLTWAKVVNPEPSDFFKISAADAIK